MTKKILLLVAATAWSVLPGLGFTLDSATKTAITDGSRNDVAAAIGNPSVVDGWTVAIPAGSFTWTSGVSIAGKGLHIRGAGGGRILGRSVTAASIGLGNRTFSTQGNLNLVAGQRLLIWRLADRSRFMEGSVVSYAGNTLVLNVTRTGGSGTADVWLIATEASTTIVQGASSPAITISEDTSHHTVISEVKFDSRAATGPMIVLNFTQNGKHTLIFDCWFHQGRSTLGIDTATNHGLVWNCSFDAEFTETEIAIRGKWNSADAVADWSTPHTMGSADVTGTRNFYIEDCNFHGYLNAHDFDDNMRLVFRYNLCNNSGVVVHGADTSNYGYRHAEWYNNEFIFNAFSDSRTLNVNRWFYIRGATGVITDNVIPDILSGYYGNKPEILFAIMSLRRNAGLYGCWGATTPGVQWPVPRQVGQGHNGTGPMLEPFYVWNNSGTQGIAVSDYTNECGPGADVASDYIKVDRDYILGPRPSYAKYAYPHPLRSAAGGTNQPPVVVVNPQSLTVPIGGTASFSAGVVGSSPMTFQWQKDGSNIPGATSSAYLIATVTESNAGAYRCSVDNAFGSAVTTSATLTIEVVQNTAATITQQPSSVTVSVGQPASFSVTAAGSSPLYYQWQKDGAVISGATGAVLNLASVATPDAGSYRCVVTNPFGTTTSQPVLLTVTVGATGITYYVDSVTGNDQNAGTAANPWRRCPGMAGWTGSATLRAGDTVYFNRSAIWDVAASPSALGPGLELTGGVRYIGNVWNPQGGAGSRATLRATAKHESGNVRFWQDHLTLATEFEGFAVNGNGFRANGIDINHSFWTRGLTNAVKRIRDCVVFGQTGNGSQGDYKYGLIVSDHSPDGSGRVSNVEILETTVYNVPRTAIALYPGDNGIIANVTVRNCIVSRPYGDPSYSATHGVTIKGDVRNSTVEHCYVYDVGGAGIFINGPENGGGSGPTAFMGRYNILQTTAAEGAIRIYGTGAKSVSFAHNLVLPNGTGGGFSISGNSGSLTANVYNNTFYLAAIDLGNASGSGTVDFANNIVFHTTALPVNDPAARLSSHRNNLYYRSGSGASLVRSGAATYTAVNLGAWESTALSSDPLFKNPSDLPNGFSGTQSTGVLPNRDGLSLLTGSPARGAGANLGPSFNGSVNGQIRPVTTGWDMGAYQTVNVPRPATPAGIRLLTD